MICPHCRTDNRPSARFCKRCGLWLLADCPTCGTTLPDNAIFCDHCGRAIHAQVVESVSPPARFPPTRLQPSLPGLQSASPNLNQFIPPELLSKLEQSRIDDSALSPAGSGGVTGERRVVTMLFCDIKDSTQAAQQLDPEVWTEIVNGAFEQMIRPVYAYEGTVARLMGDGILAFFGAPITHEDDPQRAILAGLDILSGFSRYQEQTVAQYGIHISPRIGINTGLVVVGAVGSDLRMEYTAMGDAINLAARMEQTAQPGTIQISEDTYRLVAPLFEFEDLGALEIKGRSEPVRAWRACWAASYSRAGCAALTARVRRSSAASASLIFWHRSWQTCAPVAAGW